MFDFLGEAVKAVVKLPVAIIADTVTMGGALTDEEEPYTISAIKPVLKEITKTEEE